MTVVVGPQPEPARAATPGNNFSDSFDGGAASWNKFSGDWRVENGELSQSSLSGGSNMAPLRDRRFGDATYELDLRVEAGAPDSWAGIQFKKMAQTDNPFESGFTVYVRPGGVVELYRVNTVLASVPTGLSMTAMRHLKVVTSGSNIKVYVDDESSPRIDHDDPSFASGYFGLVAFNSHWHFDNVNIVAPVLPYQIDLGPAELLYSEAEMPTFMDQSFATIAKDSTTMYSYMVNTFDPDLSVYSGPPDNPLQTRERYVLDSAEWMDENGHDAGYGMFEIWMPNMYRVSDTELIAFTHNEKRLPGESRDAEPMFSLGIAYSADDGKSWEFCGEIATPKHPRLNVGGTPYVIVGDYVYLYFNEGLNETSSEPWPRYVAVARAPLSEVVEAARSTTVSAWKKYADGSFATDPFTGTASPIIPSVFGSSDTHADATYSTALGKYLLTVQDQNKVLGRLQLFSSSDGIVWSMEAIVSSAGPNMMLPYSSFVDLEGAAVDGSTVDEAFHLQYEHKGPTYEEDHLYRKQITITTNVDARFAGSSGFSSSQGQNQWRYEQRSGATFNDMTWEASTGRWRGSANYTLVTSTAQHPDLQDAVRTWVAPETGTIRVTGTVRKAENAADGDGVRAAIWRDDQQVWPSSGWTAVSGTDTTGVDHDLTLDVAAGEKIRFIVNRNVTTEFDTTAWDPAIEYAWSAGSAFGPGQGGHSWSYAELDGSTFTAMTWDAASSRWQGSSPYSIVARTTQHPDAAASARVWTAPAAGTVRASGTVRMEYGTGGDGVRVKIMKNGTQVWPTSGWKSIAYHDLQGISHEITLEVAAGDDIAFVVDKNGSITDDTTAWDPTVRYATP